MGSRRKIPGMSESQKVENGILTLNTQLIIFVDRPVQPVTHLYGEESVGSSHHGVAYYFYVSKIC